MRHRLIPLAVAAAALILFGAIAWRLNQAYSDCVAAGGHWRVKPPGCVSGR